MFDESSTDVVANNEERVKPPNSSHVGVGSDLVQIKATSEDEVDRRIQAFIRNKRNEVDERNIREFICPLSSDLGTSCARVEAVYVRREGQKSHISLKRVENSSGPQTLLPADDFESGSHYPHRIPVDVQRAEAVEERLCNIEAHLNIRNNSQDIFARIKALEERVSYLEGLSPEYFANGLPQKKKKLENSLRDGGTISNLKQADNLSKINIKIRQLRQVLKEKSMGQDKQNLD